MAKEKQRVEAMERQLLRDIQKLTSRQFVYEDGWCGMVPFHRKLTEMQTGPPVPFADLTWREQADVLRSFIHWELYPERAWDDEYTIRKNIEAGLPPEAWLKGTSLHQSFRLLAEGKTPAPVQREPELTWGDMAQIRDALVVAGEERSSAKAKKRSRRVLDETEVSVGKKSLDDLRAAGGEKQARQTKSRDRGPGR